MSHLISASISSSKGTIIYQPGLLFRFVPSNEIRYWKVPYTTAIRQCVRYNMIKLHKVRSCIFFNINELAGVNSASFQEIASQSVHFLFMIQCHLVAVLFISLTIDGNNSGYLETPKTTEGIPEVFWLLKFTPYSGYWGQIIVGMRDSTYTSLFTPVAFLSHLSLPPLLNSPPEDI